MDSCEEVSGCFVVTGCDATVEFEFGEEVFDQVPRFVQVLIVFALLFAILPGWNDRGFAGICQRLKHPFVGVETLVGKQRIGGKAGQQDIRAFQIAGLTARKMEADRVAESIDEGVNLGAQASFAAPDGLREAPFLRAPALC